MTVPAPLPDDEIAVASLTRAKKTKRRYAGVISLQDVHLMPNKMFRFSKRPYLPHLSLRFDDIEIPALTERGWTLATDGQVQEAIEFARNLGGPLLIHCHAGVSRSGAIALAVLADRFGAGREKEALDRLLEIRDCAVPNGWVVDAADRVLGRGGTLNAVYQAELSRNKDWQWRKSAQQKVFESLTPEMELSHARARRGMRY